MSVLNVWWFYCVMEKIFRPTLVDKGPWNYPGWNIPPLQTFLGDSWSCIMFPVFMSWANAQWISERDYFSMQHSLMFVWSMEASQDRLHVCCPPPTLVNEASMDGWESRGSDGHPAFLHVKQVSLVYTHPHSLSLSLFPIYTHKNKQMRDERKCNILPMLGYYVFNIGICIWYLS